VIIDLFIEKIKEKRNPTVVGLDTCAEYLPASMLAADDGPKSVSRKIFEFNKAVIDEVGELIPGVKVQIAYYEMYAEYGIEAYKKTIEYAKSRGLVTIADAKRNDIASTAAAYSRAYLGMSDIGTKAFDADFVTVNPYLGSDGIIPFIDDCKKYDKGVFVLVKTSNKSSSEIQDAKLSDGRRVYELTSDYTAEWGKDLIGKYGYGAVGAVVGATQTAEAEKIRKRHPGMFFLLPGYGAQGATASDLAVSFDKNGLGAVVNNSRGIICAHKKNPDVKYYAAAKNAVLAMRDDLRGAIAGL
jgi:orotidine-5'-phosphate decarboxylase